MFRGKWGGGKRTHSTYYSIMAGEMGLAILAAKDLVGIEIDVVSEPHPRRFRGWVRRRGKLKVWNNCRGQKSLYSAARLLLLNCLWVSAFGTLTGLVLE